ncbi:hypothetical protein BGZ82_003902 [Podila clonocystis]|nr:hypothetical protein BGZ82_003902 [Podila clonocystis]
MTDMIEGHHTTVSVAPAQQYNDKPKKQGKLGKVFAPVGFAWSFLRRKTNLTMWIVVSMVVGVLLGQFAPKFSIEIKPLGDLFIRMIQCIVGPLIFSTLVVGIAGHGDDLARVGRLAVKSIVYFEVVTTFALIIGLVSVNIVKPGAGFSMEGVKDPNITVVPITWVTELNHIVPTTFFGTLADPKAVLALVFCAVMFSVAIMLADSQSKKVMLAFNDSLSKIMFKVVVLVMNYAPIGIGASIAYTVGKYGLGSLSAVGKLVGTLYATLIIFAVIILLPVALMARLPLKDFARTVAGPFLMAFATASSESALPKAMENMVAFGCPPEIVAFVIPTGYSFNLDGSTLYLALAAMFCAQVAGVHKSVGEQIIMMLTLMLTSKGVAAVPRASFIVLIGTLGNANIPLEPLSLILGVDAFMDMARTSINVLGNMTACAEWQMRQTGELPQHTAVMDEVDGSAYNSHGHHGHNADKESMH